MKRSNDNSHFFSLVADNKTPQRLDRLLARQCSEMGSRSQIKQRLKWIAIDGEAAKLSRTVYGGETVRGELVSSEEIELEPEALQAKIIYEDDDVITLAKPSGMVVHPAHGNQSGTLLQGIIGHIDGLVASFAAASNTDSLRPGIVHRLDKDTSGVIIVAKHPAAYANLSKQFATRIVGKLYLAVVKGEPRSPVDRLETSIARDPHNRKRFSVSDDPSAGKIAITNYRTLEVSEIGRHRYSLVALYPETGRTHQLRVHMRWIGCPILGDPVYSRRDPLFEDCSPLLHAALLRIRIPASDVPQIFCTPPPEHWDEVLRALTLLKDFTIQGETGRAVPEDTDWYESQLRLLMANHAPETPAY